MPIYPPGTWTGPELLNDRLLKRLAHDAAEIPSAVDRATLNGSATLHTRHGITELTFAGWHEVTGKCGALIDLVALFQLKTHKRTITLAADACDELE